jgi:hypothetical protein
MMDGLRTLSEPLGKVVAPSHTTVPAAFAEAAV